MNSTNTQPKLWVMDLETIVNCFVAVFVDSKTNEQKIYTISPFTNDLNELVIFLLENANNKDWHIGINNLNFDSQIVEFILDNYQHWSEQNSEEVANIIYRYAQNTIKKSNNKEYLDYPEFRLRIKCIDLYKLNHWDNHAKSTSLKWAQYSMNWHNVEEMPHEHYNLINNTSDLDLVIQYCINDVLSTKNILYLKDSKGAYIYPDQLKLRSELGTEYGINLMSAPEPKISSEIFLHHLSKKMSMNKKDIRKLRTNRGIINCKDVIFPYINFKTLDFKGVHEWYANLQVDTSNLADDEDDKKGPKYIIRHKNVKTVYGLGGIHGCIKKGVYTSTPSRIIVSADVVSFYPRLAILNELSPAHIPKHIFCELYNWFFDERGKYPKTNKLNYLYKIVLNSTYGLSKSKYSFFYDPKMTFQITINGQLLLSMLYEMITTRIPNSIPLMQNTDGLEFIIDRKDLSLYYDICKEWETLTKLSLEHTNYQKMIIGDVNNYIAVYENGKTKCKGRFEYEDLPLHKNRSMLIIPKALYNYFIHNIPPEDTIYDSCDIFDFCAGVKLKGDWYFKEYSVDNKDLKIKKHKKVLRYYMSNKGSKIIKSHPDGRNINLNSGVCYQTIFNKVVKKSWPEYDIDYKYYINAAYSEIKEIESTITNSPFKEHWTQVSLNL